MEIKDYIIELNNISKSFGDKVILDDAKWKGSGSEYTSVDGTLTLEVDTAAAQIELQSTTGG